MYHTETNMGDTLDIQVPPGSPIRLPIQVENKGRHRRGSGKSLPGDLENLGTA